MPWTFGYMVLGKHSPYKLGIRYIVGIERAAAAARFTTVGLAAENVAEELAERVSGSRALGLEGYVFHTDMTAEQEHTVKAGKTLILIRYRGA